MAEETKAERILVAVHLAAITLLSILFCVYEAKQEENRREEKEAASLKFSEIKAQKEKEIEEEKKRRRKEEEKLRRLESLKNKAEPGAEEADSAETKSAQPTEGDSQQGRGQSLVNTMLNCAGDMWSGTKKVASTINKGVGKTALAVYTGAKDKLDSLRSGANNKKEPSTANFSFEEVEILNLEPSAEVKKPCEDIEDDNIEPPLEPSVNLEPIEKSESAKNKAEPGAEEADSVEAKSAQSTEGDSQQGRGQSLVNTMLNCAGDMWSGTKKVGSIAWNGTKNAASTAWNGTKNAASIAWNGTKNAASTAWNGTKNAASSVWNWAKGIF